MHRKVPVRFGPEVAGKGPAPRAPRRRPTGVQGRDPVPGREAVDPEDRDLGVPDVLRGAAGDGPPAAPPRRDARGDGGHRGLHRAGVLRAVRAGLHRGRGDQPGARQGAEGPQDRREGLRPAGGAVRVRAAARLVHPAGGAEGGAGPDPVPDEDGPGPHLGDPAAGQGAGIGRHQARLGCQRHYRDVGHRDDRGADRRRAPRRACWRTWRSAGCAPRGSWPTCRWR